MKVRYHRDALADLAEVRAFIAQHRPDTATAVGRRIRDAIAGLAHFPEKGRPGRVPGSRELVISQLPFVVAYRITPDHVQVVSILHTARRWPSSFQDRL